MKWLRHVFGARRHHLPNDRTQSSACASPLNAYLEAISPLTKETRKEEISEQLLAYCKLDTTALLRLWQFFAGRQDLNL